MKSRRSWHALPTIGLAAGVLCLLAGLVGLGDRAAEPSRAAAVAVSSLTELLALPNEELGQVDIARMNLLCARELPGSEDLNVENAMGTLDRMAARVREETERHWYRFQRNPGEYEDSAGFFRMLMLAVVLGEDFGVEYVAGKRGTAAQAYQGDGFFADSRDVFLHGLTGSKPAGTCSSLPVLQVAVGRRLGYPLKLVTTKGHLFVRWEGKGERFNVETTGRGVNRYSDEYYLRWPMEVSEMEVQEQGYLRTLEPAGELAVFLSIRGMCWLERGQYAEAGESFRAAAMLAPNCQEYGFMQSEMERRGKGMARAE